jgi:cytochrome o ubiquinol oxidase operon protein cyoD
MKHSSYFEEIGAWPRSHKIARAYVVGFVLSLALTLLAYSLAVQHSLPQQEFAGIVALLALVQFAVQLYCFLHLGSESGSRERLLVLGAAVLIVGILISGSLWIMFSLNGRMTPDSGQMQQYMNDQGGF